MSTQTGMSITKHNMQQGSYEWHEMRCAKVTGTVFKKLMGADMLSLIDRIIAQQETGYIDDDGFVSDAMQRGTDLEPVAAKEYEVRTGVTLERIGFIHSVVHPLFGYSPDGLVGDAGEIEIKCPSTESHVRYIRQDQVPNDYKWQVLEKFILRPELEWVDFVSFDPRFGKKPMFIYRQMRGDVIEDIEKGIEQIAKFEQKFEEIRAKVLF